MEFCTVINCMDGRVQLPVIQYMQKEFNVEYVDSITEPGPVGILANQSDAALIESIFNRLDISVYKHKARLVAIVAHDDCAGNPLAEQEQMLQLESSVNIVKEKYPELKVIGLWVDMQWRVHKIYD